MKLNRFSKKQRWIGFGVLVILLIIVGYFFASSSNGDYALAEVTRGSISEQVSATGQTKAGQNIDMSFDHAGRVTAVGASVGDRVRRGQMIASLDASDLYAQLQQAVAKTKGQQAKLDEIRRGARQEDLNVSNSQVVAAESDLSQAKNNFFQAVQNSYIQSDDAIKNYSDQFFENVDPEDFRFQYYSWVTSDVPTRVDLGQRRFDIQKKINLWQTQAFELSSNSNIEQTYTEFSLYLTSVRQYLDRLSASVNKIEPSSDRTTAQLATYRTDMSTARTKANSASTDLATAYQSYISAKGDLDLANKQLNLKSASASPEELAAQEALVEQARAEESQIRAQISKEMIVAPIDGVVTRQDAKIGETISANANVVTLVSAGNFEIESNVPEIDVGKISLGNNAVISLDAFPSETWTGKVTYVEPAETIIDGVVNYKIRVSFDSNDARLKSGLTANLIIETKKVDNALILSQYTLEGGNKSNYVEKLVGDKLVKTPVTVGIRSQDGNVEILSGLSEGDKVKTVGPAK